MDAQKARMNAHRQNVYRYRHILATQLTDHERGFVKKRIAEEQEKLLRLEAVSSLGIEAPSTMNSGRRN